MAYLDGYVSGYGDAAVVVSSGGASDADMGYTQKHPRSSGAARRPITDPLDSRRKWRTQF